MTSALRTGPFLFVQGVNNDPAAILRILDTNYRGTKTTSVMLAVNEVTIKKYRPGQHMEMFVAESEDWPCVWKRLVTVSRGRCALSTSSTCCLRSRPYLPSCRLFFRPDQCSLTNSYVDDNSCWLVGSLPIYFYTLTSHRDIYIYKC
jgi:hypothetical protein